MTSLAQIIERLEKAEGPDREIDGAIAVVVAACPSDFQRERTPGRRWLWLKAVGGSTPDFCSWEAPAYTRSLDDALKLMPEDWSTLLAWNGQRCVADVHSAPLGTVGEWPAHAQAATPAIALALAALRARAALSDYEGKAE